MEQRKTVGSLLVEYGKITEDDLQEGLKVQKESGKRLGEALIDMNLITRQDIEWILSKQLDIPFIIVDESSIDTDLLYAFKKDFLLKNRIIPMYETDDEIAIVTDDPFNTDAFNAIEQMRDKKLNLSAGDSEAIEELMKKLFRREGATELVSVLDNIINILQGTSFYRLDFIYTGAGLTINAFGFGMLRQMYKGEINYSSEDVVKALDSMDKKYIYQYSESANHDSFIMAVYIIEYTVEPQAYPIILGSFGLGLPEGLSLTNMMVSGLPEVLESPSPLKGYPFFYEHASHDAIKMGIFTVDNAPKDYKNAHVIAHIPVKCPACGGEGCDGCDGQGLAYNKVDGVHSSSDIIKMLKED